ncbi:MAG: hypothetical protein GY856_08935 [bacterium]|nr:hypothetical protein [bacterium]
MKKRAHELRLGRKAGLLGSPGIWLGLAAAIGLGIVWVGLAGELGEQFGIGEGTRPAVATDDYDNAVVVRESFDGDGQGIMGRIYDSYGKPIGRDFLLNALTTDSQVKPDVVFLPSGEFVVTWQNDGPEGSEIVALRSDSYGKPIGRDFQINTLERASDPAIGADDEGNFVVAWTGVAWPGSIPIYRHFIRRFDSYGKPIGRETAFGWQTTASPPAVAVRPSGEFLVVWENQISNIRGLAFDSYGKPIGRDFRVNVFGWGDQSAPDATVALDDEYTVVWERELRNGVRSVYARRVAHFGMPFGWEHKVSCSFCMESSHPAVAADAQGNTVVTWRSAAEGESQVLARMVDLDGMPVGGEFQINWTSSGMHGLLDIAAGGPGDFIVVWESNEVTMFSEEDGPSIFGQYLTVPLTNQ